MRDRMSDPMQRLPVDPNAFSRAHPEWSPVLIERASRIPQVDDWVWAFQDTPGEPDFVGLARVGLVDHDNGLIYLAVDWDSFSEHEFGTASNSTPQVEVVVMRSSSNVFPAPFGAARRIRIHQEVRTQIA